MHERVLDMNARVDAAIDALDPTMAHRAKWKC